MAMVTPQQPTTPATTDMSWMEHTPDDANMMALGMERLQNAAKYREVISIKFTCNYEK